MNEIPKGKFSSNDDPNQNICYGCGFLGHIIKDCLNMKRKREELA